MGKKKPPSSVSSSGSYSSDDYSDSEVSTSVSRSASTSLSKSGSKVSKASRKKAKAKSVASTHISKAASRAYSTATSTKHESSAMSSTALTEKPVVTSPDTSVVALSEAPPSVFETNAKKNKGRSEVASTAASSALQIHEAPNVSKLQLADGGGWPVWDGIIRKMTTEKNSVPGYLKRALFAVKDSYIAILVGMLVVLVTLITLRPSFVLGANISRYEDPPLDMLRVGVFTVVFGVVSFVAIQSVAK